MYIKMVGLYGMENHKAYFREIGDGCFDFVNDKKFASDITREEAEKIMESQDWYLKQYNAEFMFMMR